MINFIELECPNCGAGMKRVKHDMCKCTYCNAYFIIDKEKNQVTPVPPKQVASYDSVFAVVIICLLILCFIAFGLFFFAADEPAVQPQPIVQTQKKFTTPYFIEFLDKEFGKTPDTITKEEVEKVRVIVFEDHQDQNFLQYRLEGEELKRIPIDAEVYYRTTDLCFFTGLEELDVGSQALYSDDIKRMGNLQKLACGNNPHSLAEIVRKPEKLVDLSLDYSDESLTGISTFANLESLTIDNYHLVDISEIVQLSKLKSLSLNSNELTDYEVLAELQTLTSLFFKDELAKDLSFIGKLSGLTSLEICRTKAIDISFLENNTALKRLIFDYNREIQNYLVIEKLVNLEELQFESESDMPMPNLTYLTHLKKLAISGGAELTQVAMLPELEDLSLYSGTFDVSPLSGMENLRAFHYRSIAGSIRNPESLKMLPNLEVLDLSGVDFMQDMSFVFEMPKLEELNLYDSQIGLTVRELPENDTLKVLRISNTKFVTNLQVMSSGFITVADYDTITFEECKPVITSFVGLEELYVKGQKIESLDFVSSFPSLRVLDIADNYVKDLSPLEALANFDIVYCKDNPIANKPEATFEIVENYESSLLHYLD